MSEIPAIFRKRIKAAQAKKLKELDLSSAPEFTPEQRLSRIPSEVFLLEHLESLNLSGNNITEIPVEIERLGNLKKLNLSHNKLERDPTALGRLANLEILILNWNGLRSIPDEIGRLSKLAVLDLSVNDVTSFPASLGQLQNLTALSLWTDKTRPAKIPEWLPHLKSISRLSLVRFGFSAAPNWIADWKDLTHLNLSGNQLSKVPDWVGELNKLVLLWLVDNNLIGLPGNISHLRELLEIGLWKNKIEHFPAPILDLVNLRTIELGQNQLQAVPAAIGNLQKLEVLNLAGNPLEVPPPEIAEKGVEAIREYFRQLIAEGTDHIYEAKLLIVGEGGAGKTTLGKKIIDPDYQLREEDSTRGIDVARWHFPLDNGRDFQVNIWDFGGQEVYHATHQFFLTKRSLYALVADTRKEDTDFYYWLNVAELLSDSSPILIIKNEKQDRHREINERALRGRFASLKEILPTNLGTGRGLPKVIEEIRYQISHLPHIGTPLPATWVRVREALENDPRNYINLEDYLSICASNAFAGLKARLQLSEYLHDLGVCLHFQDDPLLKKMVILRPKWGTDAVYKVLDNHAVIRNLGIFTRIDLEHIWEEPEYSTLHDELLQLMMKFKLCYPVPGMMDTYIAPQLLSVNQPDFPWEDADNLLLRYTYEFMPKGILTQFIVTMHNFISEQRLVWKSGVVLSKDQTLAEVREYYDQREIRIRVAGKHRKDLLIIATHELDKIHTSYPRLNYSKLVPCNCPVCKNGPEPHFYKLDVLRRFGEDHQSHIQCQRSYEMVDVLRLVDDVVGREQLIPLEARSRSGSSRESMSQFVVHGSVDKFIVQTSGRESSVHLDERRDANMARAEVKVRSAWANGSFYLFVFVIVIAAIGFLAKAVPWYLLPILLIAGAIFVPLIGALQLRTDGRLSQKSFLELMKLVIGQLPLLKQRSKEENG